MPRVSVSIPLRVKGNCLSRVRSEASNLSVYLKVDDILKSVSSCEMTVSSRMGEFSEQQTHLNFSFLSSYV